MTDQDWVRPLSSGSVRTAATESGHMRALTNYAPPTIPIYLLYPELRLTSLRVRTLVMFLLDRFDVRASRDVTAR